jgi:PAS domain S-box-containing protein
VAVSDALLRALATSRENVSGRGIFEIFPEELNHTKGTMIPGLRASLERVVNTLQPDSMPQSCGLNHSGGRYWSLLNSPVFNEAGELTYIILRFEESYEAGAAEHRQALLVKLLEGQRQTSDPGIMMYAAAETIGRYLKVDRTGFFENRKGDNLHFETGWSAGRLPLLKDEIPASWIGTHYLREILAGKTLGISDVRTDPLTADSRFGEIGTISLIGAPIIRNGRWHAGFYVNHAEPRVWMDEEISLVREVAELTWDAIERSRAEAALRKSEERLTFALEAGDGVGAWDWDIQADVVYCSRRFAELYSVDPERAAGGAPISAYLQGIHPSDRAQVSEKISEAIQTGRDFGEEYRVIRSDGEQRWIHARGRVYRDDAGTAVRFPGIVFDVTERRKAEEEYRRQWHLFDTALSNTPDFTYIFDLEGRFSYVNRPLLELWRRPLHDAVGKNFFELEYPPELAERLQRQIREVIETRESVRDRTPFTGPSGETRHYEYIFVPVLGGNGQLEAVAGSTRDITELEQADAELRRSNMDLERANKELEEFAYVASHDLQEPLRMVNIYTHLILEQLDSSDAKLGQYAEFVRQGVKRMEALLGDLLTFSRTEHTEESPTGVADLSAALDEALAVLKDRIESSGAVIKAEPLPIVHGDTAQMAHVFQNLISNAMKYRKKDVAPIIRISAVGDGDQWIVSVKDNGIGFLPQYAERIFGLFKRLHKDEYPGTGLGLAICQRIVKRYRGRIWAEGSPGNGATFLFALPSA